MWWRWNFLYLSIFFHPPPTYPLNLIDSWEDALFCSLVLPPVIKFHFSLLPSITFIHQIFICLPPFHHHNTHTHTSLDLRKSPPVPLRESPPPPLLPPANHHKRGERQRWDLLPLAHHHPLWHSHLAMPLSSCPPPHPDTHAHTHAGTHSEKNVCILQKSISKDEH